MWTSWKQDRWRLRFEYVWNLRGQWAFRNYWSRFSQLVWKYSAPVTQLFFRSDIVWVYMHIYFCVGVHSFLVIPNFFWQEMWGSCFTPRLRPRLPSCKCAVAMRFLGRVQAWAFCHNVTAQSNRNSQVWTVLLQHSPYSVRCAGRYALLLVFQLVSKAVMSHRYRKFGRVSVLAASWWSHVATSGAANSCWITARSPFARMRSVSSERKPHSEQILCGSMMKCGRALRAGSIQRSSVLFIRFRCRATIL